MSGLRDRWMSGVLDGWVDTDEWMNRYIGG